VPRLSVPRGSGEKAGQDQGYNMRSRVCRDLVSSSWVCVEWDTSQKWTDFGCFIVALFLGNCSSGVF